LRSAKAAVVSSVAAVEAPPPDSGTIAAQADLVPEALAVVTSWPCSGGPGRRLPELSQPAWAPRSLGRSLVEHFFKPQLFKKKISHQAPESRVLNLQFADPRKLCSIGWTICRRRDRAFGGKGVGSILSPPMICHNTNPKRF
jgi:hypothetical protein